MGRCSALGILVLPASFPATQQYPPSCRASVSPLQCFMSPGKGVSPGQGQAETPLLLQRVPSPGIGLQGPHGSQDEAPGTGQERELFPARMRAGTRLRQSCWQTCSPRARCSRALHQLCLPTGAGTCGMQAAPLERHRPSSQRSCCCPGVYHTAIIQPRGAGQNLRPPARCCGGTQQRRPPAPSGFSAPPADLWGCFPLPGALPPPVTPAAPPGWSPAGAGAPAAVEGRGCVPGGMGLGARVRAMGRGARGVHRVAWRFVAPGTLP